MVLSDKSTTGRPSEVGGVSEQLDELRGAANPALGEIYEYATQRLPQ